MQTDNLDYDALDPGIRDLVRLLRANRFETIDSGDGRSKPADERVLHLPHVFCRVDARALIGECDRMLEVLQANDVKGFHVEGNYDPADLIAIIAVLNDPEES